MSDALCELLIHDAAVFAGVVAVRVFWLMAVAWLIHLVVRWCSARRSAVVRYRIEVLSFFVLGGGAILVAIGWSAILASPHMSVSDTFFPSGKKVSDTMAVADTMALASSAMALRIVIPSAIFGIVGWTWLIGACFAIARLAADVTTSRRAIRSIDALADGARSAAVRRCTIGRARVYTSERFAEPMTVGFSRRVLLIPRAIFAHDAAMRAAILRHENAHARSADPWINLAQCLQESLLWFHPLVRSWSMRLRLEREHRADAAALAPAIDGPTLASALLECAPRSASVSRLAFSAAHGLDVRIRRLTSSPALRTSVVSSARRLGVYSLSAGAAFVAALAAPNDSRGVAAPPEVILLPPTLRAVESTGEQPPIEGGLMIVRMTDGPRRGTRRTMAAGEQIRIRDPQGKESTWTIAPDPAHPSPSGPMVSDTFFPEAKKVSDTAPPR